MKSRVSMAIVLTFTAFAAASQTTKFLLSAGDSKGSLAWRSHTFGTDGDRLIPKNDYIVEEAMARTISLCLEWKTEPKLDTGEFLIAFGAWSIPIAALEKEHYVVSVERHSSDWIAFTLLTDQGVPVWKSDKFPISRAWSGSKEDLTKHIAIVPAAELKEKKPNQSSQSTTPSVTPPAGQEARQP